MWHRRLAGVREGVSPELIILLDALRKLILSDRVAGVKSPTAYLIRQRLAEGKMAHFDAAARRCPAGGLRRFGQTPANACQGV